MKRFLLALACILEAVCLSSVQASAFKPCAAPLANVTLHDSGSSGNGAQLGDVAQLDNGAQRGDVAQLDNGAQRGDVAQLDNGAQRGNGTQLDSWAQVDNGTQLDSTSRAAIDAKLEAYCAAMIGESTQAQCTETDFLIGSCNDGETQRYVAVWLYRHFYSSKVMGHDGIAIHIYDKWFKDGGIRMYDEIDQLAADIFVGFNRNSLIGMKAPAISLEDRNGDVHELYTKPSGRASVLYFYSPDCAKCKIESIMLRNVIENRDAAIDVYAVCTSGTEAAWEEIISGSLDFSVSQTRVLHLIDRDSSKEWQMLYGVLQTPKMFLIDGNGIILGRGLDSYALDQMLQTMFAPVEMTYGEDESWNFYNGIFESYKDEKGHSDVRNLEAVAEHISKKTLTEGRDTMLFKQMTGDLLYYLNYVEGNLRGGISDFCRKYILERPDIWKTEDDSLKIIGLAGMMAEIGDRAPIGEKLPAVRVLGCEASHKGDGKVRKWKLDKLPSRISHVMLYSPECKDCRQQLEALERHCAADRKLRVLKVDIDRMNEKQPENFQKLLDGFDLTIIPYITRIDSMGKVQEKYFFFD